MFTKTILITGANRGIGLAIVQALANSSILNLHLLLGTREFSKGLQAINELKSKHLIPSSTQLDVVEIDVTNDQSIQSAVNQVETRFDDKLDVLINNAGIALLPKSDNSDLRTTYNQTFNVNITSVSAVTISFAPLLLNSPDPRVIQISSARGSLIRSTTGNLPATVAVAYSVSKTALNALTIELNKIYNDQILFQLASPDHCKTAFNNYRGTKDPLDGAKVVVKLLEADRDTYPFGYWECENGTTVDPVPW